MTLETGAPLVKLVSSFDFLRSATIKHKAVIFCMPLHLGKRYTLPRYRMSLAALVSELENEEYLPQDGPCAIPKGFQIITQ